MSLTEEDKNWIQATAERAEGKFSALLLASEERTAALLRALEERTVALLLASEERTAAKVERTETALLTDFHKWASPLEMRMRTHSAAIRAADLEIEALADRLTKLEPPH